LKPPGTKRLKLKYEKAVSSFGFNFNLRRYNVGDVQESFHFVRYKKEDGSMYVVAGPYTRPLFSST
jgi:hypothetical protein